MSPSIAEPGFSPCTIDKHVQCGTNFTPVKVPIKPLPRLWEAWRRRMWWRKRGYACLSVCMCACLYVYVCISWEQNRRLSVLRKAPWQPPVGAISWAVRFAPLFRLTESRWVRLCWCASRSCQSPVAYLQQNRPGDCLFLHTVVGRLQNYKEIQRNLVGLAVHLSLLREMQGCA